MKRRYKALIVLGAATYDGEVSPGITDEEQWIEAGFDDEFKQWIHNFSRDQLPQIYSLLEKYAADKDIIIFKARKEIQQYLKELSNTQRRSL